MKESNDQKIQEMLEKGFRQDSQQPFKSEDLQLYQELFQSLNAEQESALPKNFASHVTKKVQKATYLKQDLWFGLTIILIFSAAFGAAYLVLTLMNPEAGHEFYLINIKFKYVILLAILSFLSVFFDKSRTLLWN